MIRQSRTAAAATLIGQNQTRVFELSGDSMTVHSPDSNEHWRVRWQRTR